MLPPELRLEIPPGVSTRRVTFASAGVELVGDLYLPPHRGAPAPAAAILGPFGFVREQSPTQYAVRLAAQGVVALAFDPRNHGESGGAPRRHESPALKVLDAQAAVEFLASQPEVDATKIGVVGVCQGATPMLQAAADDGRIKALVTVAGAFLAGGGGSFIERRIKRGLAARERYARSGEVDYLPIIDPVRDDVGLPSGYIWRWYKQWEGVSRWENRYAVMSDADVWSYDVSPAASRVRCPYLMVHSEEAHSPASAREMFASVASSTKRSLWDERAPHHVQFYSDPPTVDRASRSIAEWFKAQM